MELFEIIVKSHEKDQENDKFLHEKCAGIGVPLVVNDHLDWLQIEQLQVLRVFDRSDQLNFVFRLDFVETDDVMLHLVLLFALFLRVVLLMRIHTTSATHQVLLGIRPVVLVQADLVLFKHCERIGVLQVLELVVVGGDGLRLSI